MSKKFLSFFFVIAINLFTTIQTNAMTKVFLRNGIQFKSPIVDMSSSTKKIEFQNGRKIHITQIWLINFVGEGWHFPNEWSITSPSYDTIILKNGQIIKDIIVDFSSRTKKFEFLHSTKPIHISKIRRIYFRGNVPPYYKNKIKIRRKKRLIIH